MGGRVACNKTVEDLEGKSEDVRKVNRTTGCIQEESRGALLDDRDEDGNSSKDAETLDIFSAEMRAFKEDMKQDKTQVVNGDLTFRGFGVVGRGRGWYQTKVELLETVVDETKTSDLAKEKVSRCTGSKDGNELALNNLEDIMVLVV